jgi:hypothetical protein
MSNLQAAVEHLPADADAQGTPTAELHAQRAVGQVGGVSYTAHQCDEGDWMLVNARTGEPVRLTQGIARGFATPGDVYHWASRNGFPAWWPQAAVSGPHPTRELRQD